MSISSNSSRGSIIIQGSVIGSNIAIGNDIQFIINQALSAAEESKKRYEVENEVLSLAVAGYAERLKNQIPQAGQTSAKIEIPYKSLWPYSLADAPYFFGRSQAKRRLLESVDNKGRGRLTVLQSESGAGKTSLLQAGLARELFTRHHLPLYVRSWSNSPTIAIKRALLPDLKRTPDLEKVPLRAFLFRLTDILGPDSDVFILLDQFEDFFIRVPDKAIQNEFIEELGDCIDTEILRAHFVLSLRTEQFGRLSQFRPRIPFIFDNEYALEPFTYDEAYEAILEPAKIVSLTYESGLVDEILVELKANKQQTILPAQLQLVCWVLYRELADKPKIISSDLFRSMGGVKGILQNYLHNVINREIPTDQREQARLLIEVLVRSDHTRDVRTKKSIARDAGPTESLDEVLEHLINARLLREVESGLEDEIAYELAHDYLVPQIELDPKVLARKAAQELLDQEVEAYQRNPSLRIGEEKLKIIKTQEKKINFTPKAWELYSLSKKVHLWRRGRLLGLIILAILAGLLAVNFLIQRNTEKLNRIEAEQRQAEESQRAQLQLSTQLAARAPILTNKGQIALALLLSAGAYQITSTFEARNSLFYFMDTLSDTGPSLITTLQSPSEVRSIAFSPDGKLMATGDEEGAIILWDVQTYRPIGRPLTDHMMYSVSGGRALFNVNSLAFSPDSKILASGGEDSRIILWDIVTHEPIGEPIYSHIYSSDNALLLGVRSVAFSPDGRRLVSGGIDGTVRLWDVATGTPIGKPLKDHDSGGVESVAFSPDGKVVASASEINELMLWDVTTEQPVGKAFRGPPDSLFSVVAFRPGGKILASGSTDGSILLWDIVAGQIITKSIVHSERVRALSFSPNGQFLASGSYDNSLILWEIADGKSVKRIFNQGTYVNALAFSPDSRVLAFNGDNNTIRLWNVVAQVPLHQIINSQLDKVHSITFSADSRTLVLAGCAELIDKKCERGKINFWDVINQEITEPSLIDTEGDVQAVAFAANGHMLATGNDNGDVFLWEMPSGKPAEQTPLGHYESVASIFFSAEDKVLVSASDHGTVHLWDLTRHISKPPPREGIGVNSIAVSPVDQTVAMVDQGGNLLLWDIDLANWQNFFLRSPYGYQITSMAFSPNGRTLAIDSCGELENPGDSMFCSQGAIRLWDLGTNKELINISLNRPVRNIAISPDGQIIAASICGERYQRTSPEFCQEGTIEFWDGLEYRSFDLTFKTGSTSASNLAFSPDGQYLAATIGDRDVTLWNIGFDSLVNRICDRVNRNLTLEEWKRFLGNEPYQKVCPQLPGP